MVLYITPMLERMLVLVIVIGETGVVLNHGEGGHYILLSFLSLGSHISDLGGSEAPF